MNGWTAALLSVGLVVNPPGFARSVGWRGTFPTWRTRALAVVAAIGALLIGISLLTSPILEGLDLSTATFRLAAALVVGITGAKWFVSPGIPADSVANEREADAHAATALLTPGPVLAAMAANSEAGVAAGIVSVAVAIGATAALLLMPRLAEPGSGALTRFLGALTLVVAVAIGIDSARTV